MPIEVLTYLGSRFLLEGAVLAQDLHRRRSEAPAFPVEMSVQVNDETLLLALA